MTIPGDVTHAVRVDPVTAWRVLHDNLRVLSLPVPLPDELRQCRGCAGCDPVPGCEAGNEGGDMCCGGCKGTGRRPVRVALYADNEWTDVAVKEAGDDYWWDDEKSGTHGRCSPDTGKVLWVRGTDGAHRMGVNAFVAVAEIADCHEIYTYGNGCVAYWGCPGEMTRGSWHWRVGSVEPIDPVRWEPCQDCGASGIGPTGDPNSSCYTCGGEGDLGPPVLSPIPREFR